jgi:hypothetical protein
MTRRHLDERTSEAAVTDDAAKVSSDQVEQGGWFAKWRPVLAWIVLVLAAVLVLVSSLTIWVKRQALNTDSWVDASSQLLEDPAVRTAVANYLVEELFQTVNVPEELQRVLPAQLDPLAAPAASALRGAAVNQAQALLASPRVQKVWEEANRKAHETFIDVVENKKTGLIATYNGDVVLDLQPLLQRLRDQVGVNPERAPLTSGRIVLMRADQLEGARNVVRGIRVLSVVLGLVAIALFALAIWLGVGRRRKIIIAAGFSLILISVILAVVRRIGGNYVVDALTDPGTARDAADSAWFIGTSLLRDVALGLLFYGLAILFGVWISGPGRRAVATRRALAPIFRDRAWILFGIVVIVMLLILLFGPGAGTRTWVGVLVLAVGLLGGTELLRRQTLREFPESARTA